MKPVPASCKAALCALLGLLLAGCHYLRPAEVPMTARYFQYSESASTLVVLLHGLGGSAHNFVKYDTVAQIRACRSDANVIGVDSHFGYYRERVIIERLRKDVIEPALADGITEVWLLGVSLGGLGSVVYRQAYPAEVAGLLLMAPYLGERDDLQAYLDDPAGYRQQSSSEFIELWEGLRQSRPSNDAVTLAYGEDDDFNWQHRWLAGLLDDANVLSGPGGHRWKVWRDLWPGALRRSGLCS